jgi:hypothetical protein
MAVRLIAKLGKLCRGAAADYHDALNDALNERGGPYGRRIHHPYGP